MRSYDRGIYQSETDLKTHEYGLAAVLLGSGETVDVSFIDDTGREDYELGWVVGYLEGQAD